MTTMMMTTANVVVMAEVMVNVAATECVVAWTWAKWVAMASVKAFAALAPIAA